MSDTVPIVSIIIPVYNRSTLIPDTLRSILAQEYQDWECIVVDDGSIDDTVAVVTAFAKADSRISLFQRPETIPKGANACRNYGYLKSKGIYVNWFDSDDLMYEGFLSKKVIAITEENIDYVISKTTFFEAEYPENKTPYVYKFELHDFTHYNYVSHKINWLTPDALIKKEVLERHAISWNDELLTTAQEYNLFCKLTAVSLKAKVIDDIVTGYRFHESSIEGNLRTNRQRLSKERSIGYELTRRDLLGEKVYNKHVQAFFISQMCKRSLDTKMPFTILRSIVMKRPVSWSGKTLFLYVFYQIVFHLFGKGHAIRKQYIASLNTSV